MIIVNVTVTRGSILLTVYKPTTLCSRKKNM